MASWGGRQLQAGSRSLQAIWQDPGWPGRRWRWEGGKCCGTSEVCSFLQGQVAAIGLSRGPSFGKALLIPVLRHAVSSLHADSLGCPP